MNYCIDGVEGNIELKCSRYPKAKYPFKKGGLRLSQRLWMRDRVEAESSRVYILAQVGKERFLICGVFYNEFNGATLEDLRKEDLLSADPNLNYWLFSDDP